MRSTKVSESAGIDRAHLIRVLLEQMERTYGTEGEPGVTRMIAELLCRLGDASLREYAYSLGLTTELELEPEDASGRTRPPEEPL